MVRRRQCLYSEQIPPADPAGGDGLLLRPEPGARRMRGVCTRSGLSGLDFEDDNQDGDCESVSEMEKAKTYRLLCSFRSEVLQKWALGLALTARPLSAFRGNERLRVDRAVTSGNEHSD